MSQWVAGFIALAVCAATSARAEDAPTRPSPNLRYHYPLPPANPPQTIDADIVVYGGTSGGAVAAIQAARMGKKTVLVEFGRNIGGLTSGGLSATDGGAANVCDGIAREFYKRKDVGQSGMVPSKAEAAYREMLKTANVPIFTEHRLKAVKKDGARITEIEMENGNVFRAEVFIDCTYEGDLMAMAKCSFHVGREANSVFKETINGIWAGGGHDFSLKVDPYVKPGDPASGLLKEISAADPGKKGEGDSRIQAYCFRMRLTTKADRLPFPKPEGYDAERYLLLARYLHQLGPDPKKKGHANLSGDTNNHHLANGAMFIDYVGGSDGWPDGDYPTREKIYQAHVTYQMGVMYFLTHDERVPAEVRAEFAKWGLPADEYRHTGGWTHQLYIREGRRMISDYVMTEHDCTGKTVAEDSIGLATYNMDSHHCQRVVIEGHVVNEGNVEVKSKAYPIAYRAIVPAAAACENLLVPVCLSSSHIAYGSIRMEPVFMILGQSAGTAAALAIDEKCTVQKLDYMKLRERLLADKQILDPPGPKK